MSRQAWPICQGPRSSAARDGAYAIGRTSGSSAYYGRSVRRHRPGPASSNKQHARPDWVKFRAHPHHQVSPASGVENGRDIATKRPATHRASPGGEQTGAWRRSARSSWPESCRTRAQTPGLSRCTRGQEISSFCATKRHRQQGVLQRYAAGLASFLHQPDRHPGNARDRRQTMVQSNHISPGESAIESVGDRNCRSAASGGDCLALHAQFAIGGIYTSASSGYLNTAWRYSASTRELTEGVARDSGEHLLALECRKKPLDQRSVSTTDR